MSKVTPFRWAHAFIDVPEQSVGPAEDFWSAATGYAVGEPWSAHNEFVSLLPGDGSPYVHIQRIGGAPRVHFDFASDDIDADTRRLVSLGAATAGPRHHWQTLTSPGGLPFCVVDETDPKTVARSVLWDNGRRSRVVQVCIDIPPDVHDRELEFWTAATGWRLRDSSRSEFHSLLPPATAPIQLLVQRLDEGTGPVQAHLDLGCDDIDAEATRLSALGADIVARMDHWVLLRDPVGLEFCATPRRPDGIT